MPIERFPSWVTVFLWTLWRPECTLLLVFKFTLCGTFVARSTVKVLRTPCLLATRKCRRTAIMQDEARLGGINLLYAAVATMSATLDFVPDKWVYQCRQSRLVRKSVFRVHDGCNTISATSALFGNKDPFWYVDFWIGSQFVLAGLVLTFRHMRRFVLSCWRNV